MALVEAFRTEKALHFRDSLTGRMQAILTIHDQFYHGGRLDLLVDTIKAKTDQLTFTVANSVDATATATVSDAQIAAIAAAVGSGVAEDVWANATRTLTQTAAEVASVLSGSDITIHRGDSFSLSLTGLGNISTRTKLWFTVKSRDVLDSQSTIQIRETAGLLYLNGAAATAGQGSITVTDATAGDITIVLDEAATAALGIASGLSYDIQVLTAAGNIQTLTEGLVTISVDVTKSIA